MEYPGRKRAPVQCLLPQIQTKVRHNTFQNEDAGLPCYFSRTNQDSYFHPVYQDERDQCWRQRRNKTKSLQQGKGDGENPQSAEENSVFCSFCQKINFLSVRYTWLFLFFKRKNLSAEKVQVCVCRANVVAYVNTDKHTQVTAGQVKYSNDKYQISEILGSMQ